MGRGLWPEKIKHDVCVHESLKSDQTAQSKESEEVKENEGIAFIIIYWHSQEFFEIESHPQQVPEDIDRYIRLRNFKTELLLPLSTVHRIHRSFVQLLLLL